MGLPLYRPRNQLILVFDKTLSIDELTYIFKYCWTSNFLQVIIVFLKNSQTHIYGYNPFWGEEIMLENYTLTPYNKNIYYNRLSDINGYNLTCLIIRSEDYSKIITIKQGNKITYMGIDADLISNIVKSINGTPRFVDSEKLKKPEERNPWRHSNILINNTLQRKKEIITENNIDMVNADVMSLNDDFSGITESLYPHDKEDLIFLVKRGEKIPYYIYLFMIFQTNVWIIFFVTIIFITVLWVSIIHCFNLSYWNIEWLEIFRSVICTSTQIVPRSNSERIFYISWVVYCFIVAISFQSKLTDMLMEPKYYPDITTLEALEKSGIKIQTFQSWRPEITKSLINTSWYKLLDQIVNVHPFYDQLNSSAIYYNMTFFNKGLMVQYSRAIFTSEMLLFCSNTRKLLNIIPESPLPTFLAFQVIAGSPYLNQFDENMAKFTEFGLIKYWKNKWDHFFVLKKIKIPTGYDFNGEENTSKSSITLSHLGSAFMVLLSGLVFSVIIFMFELIMFRFNIVTLNRAFNIFFK